jgi:large subunit ribosomal protein L21
MEDTKNLNATYEQYAIFATGGKQYQAVPGKTLAIEKIEGEAGASLEFNDVLFRKTAEGSFEVGTPFIKKTIKASIVKQIREPKIIVFKFKRRKKARRKQGHRQHKTVIRIDSI